MAAVDVRRARAILATKEPPVGSRPGMKRAVLLWGIILLGVPITLAGL